MNPPRCNCDSWQHVVRQQKNGIIVVVKQCLTCGRSLGNVKKDAFDLSSLPAFNQSTVDAWRRKMDEWSREQRRLFDLKQNEWFLHYNEYLRSNHWQKLRNFVLRRDPICQACFNRPSDQVHHVSYEGYKRFGISFPVECIGICIRCHDLLHQRENH